MTTQNSKKIYAKVIQIQGGFLLSSVVESFVQSDGLDFNIDTSTLLFFYYIGRNPYANTLT